MPHTMNLSALLMLDRPHLFSTDPATLDARIRRRISRSEFIALMFAVGMLLVFSVILRQQQITPPDYYRYLEVARGEFYMNYYAYWIAPVFWVLGVLPMYVGYIAWGVVGIIGTWFASRVFGGLLWPALLSYQMMYISYYGQITPLLVGALGVMWWAMAHKRWHVAGAALILACTKFQFGIPLGLILLLMANASWKQRALVFVVPIFVFIASLLGYGLWPLDILDNLLNRPPGTQSSISLWEYIGPAALLLWLPPLLLPMSKQQRMVALTATVAIGLPYFQQTDLLFLYILPTGALAVLGNAGYGLFATGGWYALRWLAVIPLIMYLAVVVPAAVRWIQANNKRVNVLSESPSSE